MARWMLVGVLLAGACGFQAEPADPAADVDPGSGAGPGPGTDPVADPPPGPPPVTDGGGQIVYIATADESPGTGDLKIGKSIVIDTSTMNFGMPLPAGVSFTVGHQDGAGPELAILHVKAFSVDKDRSVRASGSRPLVVVSDSFDLVSTLDVSAQGTTGGPGALSADAAAPSGGLVGGAPGISTGPLCGTVPTGGGGGAIEIYAATSITISGVLQADGGTAGTLACANGLTAPNPGGAGGMIVLQAPDVSVSGRLSASGGDGGATLGLGSQQGPPGKIVVYFKDRGDVQHSAPVPVKLHY